MANQRQTHSNVPATLCTATMTFPRTLIPVYIPALALLHPIPLPLQSQSIRPHLKDTQQDISLLNPSFIKNPQNTFHPNHQDHSATTPIMPVPMPSSTTSSNNADAQTSSSATAETVHNVANTATQSVASASHTEKTEAEKEAERRYEEAIEEEYAKREGGA